MNLEPFTFVLERVSQFLIDEVKFLSTDTKKLFHKLEQQLDLAQSFVKDVEEEKEKATISHVLETESQHVMLILPHIDDFLDTLQLGEDIQKIQQPSPIQKFMSCFSCSSNPLVHKHVMIDTANKLISDLEDTRKRAEPYRRQSNIAPKKRALTQTQPTIMNDEFIVGLDEDVKSLVTKLKGIEGDSTTILAIVGMGGSGKTTLARKLYNHEEIKGRFTSCLAWVCVSQEWDASRLLREICLQLHIPLAEGESTMAGFKLQEFLQTSSCLVVLDDVWEMKALQELLPSLLSRGGTEVNGRVLITTRKEEILHYPAQGGVYIHEARALTPKQSWVLFSKIIRNKWQGKRLFEDEGNFARLGKEMLERCDGLALAIVALAGLLSTKGTIQEWEIVKDRVSSTILRKDKGSLDYGPVRSMLELSYSDLPYYLKSCFLYLGIYPEDEVIHVGGLIELWIGEGLLRRDLCSEGQTLEELGMDFVHELAQRCMVQVSRTDNADKASLIRVHDLMRDICIEKAGDSGFFEIVSESTIPSTSKEQLSRRAIFQGDGNSQLIYPFRLRSIITKRQYPMPRAKLEIAYGEMKLLRVLHLYFVDLTDSAHEIGNLTLLRYLSFTDCTRITNKVLKSVKRLINLLTLVLVTNEQLTVPNDMVGGMKQLRHLQLKFYREVQFEQILGVGGSTSLQCLSSDAGEWLSKELPDVNFILTLRTLEVYKINSQAQLEAINDFVSNPSNNLRVLSLSITGNSGLEFDLHGMKLECCPLLEDFRLEGPIRKQMGPFFFPPNLLNLILNESKIEKAEDLERALTQLHQLRCLKLHRHAFEGDTLTMTKLLQLQTLQLEGLKNLREWRIDEGSLPQLKNLEIFNCRELERIPEGISHIHNLQHLHAFYVSPSFCIRLEKPTEKEEGSEGSGGQDFHLICHIPDINIKEKPLMSAVFTSRLYL